MSQVKVVYDDRYGEWIGHTSGISRTSDILGDTKQAVVKSARNVAKRYEAKLIVEKKNGARQYTNDYRNSGSGSSSKSGGSMFDDFL